MLHTMITSLFLVMGKEETGNNSWLGYAHPQYFSACLKVHDFMMWDT